LRYCLIYITAEDEDEARQIGKTLVKERLAACVNIHPVKSVFRWQGKIEEEEEVAMLVKTKAELADRVIKRVKELHSYEVPDIISIPIDKGYPDYLKWIEETTR
jgi:periplasmic divalent cation tolerance protein